MKTTLAILVLIVVAVGTVYTQTEPPSPPKPSEVRLEGPALPNFPGIPQPPAPASQPKARTIDQILEEIEQVRAQKLELEKREKALALEARKLLDKQTERLNRLGLGTPVQPAPVVDPPPDLVLPGVGR